MPDLRTLEGHVQWEAPSNRKSGQFKDTNQKRRDWWARKARAVGINPNSGRAWLSETAKRIHPTMRKPCKVCGRVMDIRYAYPNSNLIKRIQNLPYVDESFPLDELEHILELVPRMVEQLGNQVLNDLHKLLKSKGIAVPQLGRNLDEWLQWIESTYMPQEPSMLGPGAMANPPDRLDGFHTYNRCCRPEADKGRSKANLRSYTTDRRVFEYWVDGDWVAADRMMGLIRSNGSLRSKACFNGHPGNCTADHIGPISLGFTHRPEFRLLCKACNSAKNNRMKLSDVEHLREVERDGEEVVSWYARRVWDLCKQRVATDEEALRLSKLLRDNRHAVMRILYRIYDAGHLVFLSQLLHLEYAQWDVLFEEITTEHSVVTAATKRQPRDTKYVEEQRARRLRVAFSVLREYAQKDNRNAIEVPTPEIQQALDRTFGVLRQCPRDIRQLDADLFTTLDEDIVPEARLRGLVTCLPSNSSRAPCLIQAREHLQNAVDLTGDVLASMWGAERYVRASEEELA
jgi:Alw26I/Eco31I/Esp3I family type II restriction endonuclease